MKDTYYRVIPISRQVILEVINCIEGIENIKIDDPRLTDSLCQEITDNWEDLESDPCENTFFEDSDSVSEEWENKLREIFK